MQMTLEEYKKLYPVATQPQFKLTPEKQHYRYIENQLQESFVATFREMQKKGVFKTVPDLEYIELMGMPNFGAKDKEPKKRIMRGAMNKRMGYKAGWPDITIIWKLKDKNPRFGFIEVKAPDGVLSDSQKELHPLLVAANIPLAVMRKHDDGMKALKRWGLLPSCYAGMY